MTYKKFIRWKRTSFKNAHSAPEFVHGSAGSAAQCLQLDGTWKTPAKSSTANFFMLLLPLMLQLQHPVEALASCPNGSYIFCTLFLFSWQSQKNKKYTSSKAVTGIRITRPHLLSYNEAFVEISMHCLCMLTIRKQLQGNLMGKQEHSPQIFFRHPDAFSYVRCTKKRHPQLCTSQTSLKGDNLDQ